MRTTKTAVCLQTEAILLLHLCVLFGALVKYVMSNTLPIALTRLFNH